MAASNQPCSPGLGERSVHQGVAALAGERFQSLDLSRRERPEQELAGWRMERCVAGDRRRVANRGRDVGRDLADHHTATGVQAVLVLCDRSNIFVAGGQPHASEPVAVGDGALVPKVIPNLMRVGRVVRMGVVKVCLPVRYWCLFCVHEIPLCCHMRQ